MPRLKKAELIEGVVYVHPCTSSLSWSSAYPSDRLARQYEANTPGVEASDNVTVRLDLDNEPQPDALLFIDPPVAAAPS